METIDNPTKLPGASESKASTPELPLTPNETAILQEIHTSLNHLCIQLSSINEGVQERKEVTRMQLLNSGRGDSEVLTEEGAIAEYLCLNEIADVDPNEIELSHQDSSGRLGCNIHDPIGAILMDLLNVRYRIETLIHIKSPQTKAALGFLQTSLRLSNGDSIHGRTDKSIDTNNPR